MDILFFILSAIVLYGAFQVITHTHLVVCALHLAGSMLALAGLFFILGAHFIAAVQVLVYAGAVMVLFIMVVMLFNLKESSQQVFSSWMGLKAAIVFFFIGLVAGVFPASMFILYPFTIKEINSASTVNLAKLLFSEYLFAFECVGVLLLVIAVGAAVLCLRTNSKENKW